MEFEAVYRRYHRELFAVAAHCLMDGDLAQDVIQDTFIKYKKASEAGKIIGNPKNWLYRVTLNGCFDLKRYLKRFSRDLVDTLIGKESNTLELSDEIVDLLKGLSEKERAVLTLKYMEEMSYQEIALVMNLPEGTLKSIASRALAKVKKDERTI